MTELGLRRDEGLVRLLAASIASTSVLVVYSSEQETQIAYWRITESQRQNLMKQIEEVFGLATVQEGPKDSHTYSETAAAGIYEFLSDRKRKSTDSKRK